MESSLKTTDASTRELTVELSKTDLDSYVADAESSLGKQIHVDGFRKGKVPSDVVRKHVNEAQLREEALRIAVERSLAQAIQKNNLDVLDQADFKIQKNTPDNLTYTVKLILYPTVQLGTYKGIEVKKRAVKVADEEVDRMLKDVAQSRAAIAQVDRSAAVGDQVEVDFTLKLKGEIIDGGESKNHPLVIGEKRFIPGFEDQLIGLKVGETKEFKLSIPKDYHEKNIAGKELDVMVTMRDVKSRTVPEITDEFAKGLGQFASLENLKEEIKKNLLKEKEEQEEERLRIEILKTIVKNSELTVPALMVERQLDGMVQNFDAELHARGMELGPYLAHLKKTQEELRNDWKGRAEDQVKMTLVIHEVAKAEKLEVKNEDIDAELEIQLQQYMGGRPGMAPADMQKLDLDRARREIYSSLVNKKVFDFLHTSAILGE